MTPSQALQQQTARRDFAAAVALDETRLDLARAALLIAAEEEPGLAIAPHLTRINELGQEARLVLEFVRGHRVVAFNEYFFETLGFNGNRRNYQDPRNSFLNRVLERRTGIPITLSLLYYEIGRRAGLEVEGIGMPGHFLVRVRAAPYAEPLLVDTFHTRIMTPEDCQDKLDEIYEGRLPLHKSHLLAVTKKQILARMLANLKSIYTQAQLLPRALAASERILLILPDAHAERRDSALLAAALQRWGDAIRWGNSYLHAAPAAPDFTEIREQVKNWQRRQAQLN